VSAFTHHATRFSHIVTLDSRQEAALQTVADRFVALPKAIR